MAGSKNDVLVGKNADFSQAGGPNAITGEANGLITNGQLWIGSTALNVGGTHINVGSLVSLDGSISIGYSSPNITLSAASSGVKTINGDIGSITGSTVTIFANNATNNAGSTVLFNNSGTVSTLNVTDSNLNTIIGKSSGVLGGTYGNCIVVGSSSCTSMGNTTSQNIAIGNSVLQSFVGAGGSQNIGIGESSLVQMTEGANNIAIGILSGLNYLTTETNNILIGNTGVVGDNNVMRLGTPSNIQNCFIAGIVGVTTSNTQLVTIDSTSGQLGVTNTIPLAYTNVNFAASPYTVLSTDQYISVDSSGGAITLEFPNAPIANTQWIVKDRTGNSAANNITITTVSGVVTIDGATTFVISSNFGSIQMLANATPTYEVF